MRSAEKDSIKVISEKSYAKINLFLEVLGKRTDGFHQLRTVYSEVDLYDKMNFLLTKENDVKLCTDIELGDISANTVYRVAVLMSKRYGVESGVEILLHKRIPVTAGLGGGSSNAATTIKVLSRLWDLNLKEEEMHSLASEIGSDINFFLIGGTALGEGRGEIVTPIKPIDYDMLLLVKPDFGISSRDAYHHLSEYGDNDDWKLLCKEQDPRYCFNRLEKDLFIRYPLLKEIQCHMKENGALKAIVSGSGSTVVGFYGDRNIYDDHFNYYRGKGFWCCQAKTKRR